jgi:hypothetical protein
MASPLNLTYFGFGSGLPSIDGTVRNYRVTNNKAVLSLFSRGVGQFSPYPTSVDKKSGNVTSINNAAGIHNDDMHDTSISSIVQYCNSHPGMELDFADFAYLKNVGVYPNNRLIIARRFPSPIGSDLTAVKVQPLSTLISWMNEEDADAISIKFNEVYGDGEANFTQVLNDIGSDLKASSDQTAAGNLGNIVGKAFDILPFPGFMEGVINQVMNEMGLTEHGFGNSPFGNPNIIAQSRIRKTQDFSQSGSGLEGKFNIKMVVEYEQKFINGVDPTLVYLDIIQNALSFGTSDSSFRFNTAFGEGVEGVIKDMISGDIALVFSALVKLVQSILNAIVKVVSDLAEAFLQGPEEDGEDDLDSGTIIDMFAEAIKRTFGHVISKYKIRLLGIVNALTGAPSTPWHVTIGNPRKPFFSSGDMECTDVTLTLGKTLAFNDLPSSVKLTVNFTSARNLGAQEIFNRFNTGKGRSYARTKLTFEEHPDPQFTDVQVDTEAAQANAVAAGQSGSNAGGGSVSNTGTSASTQQFLSVGSYTFKEIIDDYKIKGDMGGTNWLQYSGPAITSGVKDNTNPEVSNTPVNNLSNQSSTNTGNTGQVGVVTPISGTPSPSTTTGLTVSGQTGSGGGTPSLTPEQLAAAEKAKQIQILEGQFADVSSQLSFLSPEIIEIKFYKAGRTIGVVTSDKGLSDVKNTDEYKALSLASDSVQSTSRGNPKYEQLMKKKNEIEGKIKNLKG